MNTTEYAELSAELTALGRKILPHSHNLSYHDQEEVIQDALIELVHAVEQGFVETPEALFRVILERRVIDKVRALKARAKHEVPAKPAAVLAHADEANEANFSAVTPAQPLTGDEQLFVTAFNQELPKLPEPARTAFVLVDLRGLTMYEAGLELGLTKPGVQWHVEAARKTLRSVLS